jgi:hypothetical protein
MEAARMKYMLLIYMDENVMSTAERERCYNESAQYAQELSRGGKYLDAAPLHPTSTATSVRVKDGKQLITDGPFAETREQLGGYSWWTPTIWMTQSASPRRFRAEGGEPLKSGQSWR